MVELIVKRAFLHQGVRVEPGQVVKVDPTIAPELVHWGKAEMAGVVPAVSGPMTTESAPATVKGKRKKSESMT